MKLRNKLVATVLSLAMIAVIGVCGVSAATSVKSVANNSTTSVPFGGSVSVKCGNFIPQANASSYRSGIGKTETFQTQIYAPARSALYAYAYIITPSGKVYQDYKTNCANYRTEAHATAQIPFNWFWTEGSKSTTGFVKNKNFGVKLNFKVK